MNRLKVGSAFHTIKNLVRFFHIAIIASFLLIATTSGCGYKTSPVWVDKSAKAQSAKK